MLKEEEKEPPSFRETNLISSIGTTKTNEVHGEIINNNVCTKKSSSSSLSATNTSGITATRSPKDGRRGSRKAMQGQTPSTQLYGQEDERKISTSSEDQNKKNQELLFIKCTYTDYSSNKTYQQHDLTANELRCLRLYRENRIGGPFPIKLQIMLKVVEGLGKQNIISWQPHGRAFMIHRPTEFDEELMSKFFKSTKLASFKRQLHLYDFQRITHGNDAGAYYHEMFLRGKPLLATKMTRRKIKGNIRVITSPDEEPQFYTMPFMGPTTSDDCAVNLGGNILNRGALSTKNEKAPDTAFGDAGGSSSFHSMINSGLVSLPQVDRPHNDAGGNNEHFMKERDTYNSHFTLLEEGAPTIIMRAPPALDHPLLRKQLPCYSPRDHRLQSQHLPSFSMMLLAKHLSIHEEICTRQQEQRLLQELKMQVAAGAFDEKV